MNKEEKSVIDQTVAEVEAEIAADEKEMQADEEEMQADEEALEEALEEEIDEIEVLADEVLALQESNKRHRKRIMKIEADHAGLLIQMQMCHDRIREIDSSPGAPAKVVNIHI